MRSAARDRSISSSTVPSRSLARRSAGALFMVGSFADPACAYDIDDWPDHHAFGDGTEIGLYGAYRYDLNDFGNDAPAGGASRFADAATNRRKELGATLRKNGVYDIAVAFEYQSRTWLDLFLRVQSGALLGTDAGAFRIGYSKVPLAFEGLTSTKADTFLELALPVQAIYQGRRTGIDWELERPAFLVDAGCYFGQDLLGDNDGTTLAGRVAWTPRKTAGNVVHLGVAASRESRDRTTDGRGIAHPPSIRFSTPPEAGLTPVRLVDSGTLSYARRVERSGVEALWIAGPWSVQGEYLRATAERGAGNRDFSAAGFYVFGSWVVTGEARPYASGNVGNIKPKNPWGALELLLRFSELDLDDGPVRGGKEHDVTLGANWYLTQHFKFQANYIRARSERGNLSLDPRIVELRAQIYF